MKFEKNHSKYDVEDFESKLREFEEDLHNTDPEQYPEAKELLDTMTEFANNLPEDEI